MREFNNATLNRIAPYIGSFLAINLIYWVIRFENWWHFFGFPIMNPSFADLRAYTSAVSCSQQGIDYLAESCDPFGRNIGLLRIYVPIFKFFNFNENYTALIGNFMQVLLFTTIYFLAYALRTNLRNPKNSLLLLLLLVSPPIALLVERGQLEIIVFIFVMFSAFLIHKNWKIPTYLLLGFASILKFYPIFLLGYHLVNRRIKNSKAQLIIGLLSFGVSVGVVIIAILGEERTQFDSALGISASRTFGITALPYRLKDAINILGILPINIKLSRSQVMAIGYLFFLLIIFTLLIFRHRGRVFKLDLTTILEDKSLSSFVLLATLFLMFLSYFLVSSYYYRMVYLVPLFLIGLTQMVTRNKDQTGSCLTYGILIVMWTQINIPLAALSLLPILLIVTIMLFNITPTLLSSVKWIGKSANRETS